MNRRSELLSQEKIVNAGGIVIDTEKMQDTAAKIFGVNLDCAYQIDKSLTAIASYQDSVIKVSEEIPAEFMVRRLQLFQEITGYDLGLYSPKQPIVKLNHNEKISEIEQKVAYQNRVISIHPLAISDKEGERYSRESTNRYRELIKLGIENIKNNFPDKTVQNIKINEFINEHLITFAKISEISLKSFYQGTLIHEKRHQLYQHDESRFASPEYIQKVKDNIALALISVTCLGSTVGGLMAERAITLILSHRTILPSTVTYADISTLIFTGLLSIITTIKLNDSQDSRNLHNDERLAYQATGLFGPEIKGVVSIDRKELYKRVFKNTPEILTSSNII
ncbi:MAG: hypothetical protein WC069_02545 [Candidatus Shapirobacteria bacterium]